MDIIAEEIVNNFCMYIPILYIYYIYMYNVYYKIQVCKNHSGKMPLKKVDKTTQAFRLFRLVLYLYP